MSVQNSGDDNLVTGNGDTVFSGYLVQTGEGPGPDS